MAEAATAATGSAVATPDEVCEHPNIEIIEYSNYDSLTIRCVACQTTVVIPSRTMAQHAGTDIADVVQGTFGLYWAEYLRAWSV